MTAVLKRLRFLEQRIAQLEARLPTRPATGADVTEATEANLSAHRLEADAARSPHRDSLLPAGARSEGPPTERLDRLPGAASSQPFPDLSLLEEKLERRKGPAERIEVQAAIEAYPRIARRIEELWGTPECEHFLNTLVIDTRGNRQGFPPAVLEELLYLGRLARALVILQVRGDLWDRYDHIGDRR